MLLQFSVENFLSFREEAVLNLTAAEGAGDPKHPAYAEAGGERVLRCAALYGANASGKSNLVRALAAARALIVGGTAPGAPLPSQPFLLDEAFADRPTRFAFHLAVGDDRYEYALSFSRESIAEEYLYRVRRGAEALVFERPQAGPEIVLGGGLEAERERAQFVRFVAEGTRRNQPFLAEARARNVRELAAVTDWFASGFFALGSGEPFIGVARSIERDGDQRGFSTRLLQMADAGIEGLEAKRAAFDDQNPLMAATRGLIQEVRKLAVSAKGDEMDLVEEDGKLFFVRPRTIRRTRQGTPTPFEMDSESDGTRRFLELSPVLFAAGERQVGFALDELERSLHPLLTRRIVQLFLGSTPNGRNQLIFTTHDTNLLNRNLLPADAVWFAQKDAHGASKLYSLADFKPDQLRELTGTLEEGYLQGRFGAIPFLGDPTALGWHGPSGGPGGGGKTPPSKAAQAKSTKAGVAPAKASTGSGSTPAKKRAGSGSTPAKELAGAGSTPAKKRAGTGSISTKRSAGSGSTPAKRSTGAGQASTKRSAGVAKKGGRGEPTSTRKATRAAGPEAKNARSARRPKAGAS